MQVKFQAQELDHGVWANNFGGLKLEAKLGAEIVGPQERTLDKGGKGMRGEDAKKVIKVVTNTCRDIALENPMQCLSKQIEYIWCQAHAKHENEVMVEFACPLKAQKWPVSLANEDVAECRFQIEFKHQEAWS